MQPDRRRPRLRAVAVLLVGCVLHGAWQPGSRADNSTASARVRLDGPRAGRVLQHEGLSPPKPRRLAGSCPGGPGPKNNRRVVDDITDEEGIEVLVEHYTPQRFDKPPQPAMASAEALAALCKQYRYRFCPNPLRGKADHDWYACAAKRFVAKLECGSVDYRTPTPGMVFDRTRTFPVHGCHPKKYRYQPARTGKVAHFPAVAHNLAVYPTGFAHVLNQLPRLLFLLETIPADVPIVLAKSAARIQFVDMLYEKGVLNDKKRIIDWDPSTTYSGDVVYFAGEMGNGPQTKDWYMLKEELCSWAMMMPRPMMQELFTKGMPPPFHAALPGNMSTASASSGAVVPLWTASAANATAPACHVLVVHRKDAPHNSRMVKNHADMFKALKEQVPECRFTEFVGTEHTLLKQITMFTEADVVVAPHGAALGFLSFMRPGAGVVEIGYTSLKGMKFPAPYYMILALTVNVRYYLTMAQGGYGSTLTANVPEVVDLTRRALSL